MVAVGSHRRDMSFLGRFQAQYNVGRSAFQILQLLLYFELYFDQQMPHFCWILPWASQLYHSITRCNVYMCIQMYIHTNVCMYCIHFFKWYSSYSLITFKRPWKFQIFEGITVFPCLQERWVGLLWKCILVWETLTVVVWKIKRVPPIALNTITLRDLQGLSVKQRITG